jgi:hypothetical protein
MTLAAPNAGALANRAQPFAERPGVECH